MCICVVNTSKVVLHVFWNASLFFSFKVIEFNIYNVYSRKCLSLLLYMRDTLLLTLAPHRHLGLQLLSNMDKVSYPRTQPAGAQDETGIQDVSIPSPSSTDLANKPQRLKWFSSAIISAVTAVHITYISTMAISLQHIIDLLFLVNLIFIPLSFHKFLMDFIASVNPNFNI